VLKAIAKEVKYPRLSASENTPVHDLPSHIPQLSSMFYTIVLKTILLYPNTFSASSA
jgi:hypothetical protein